MKSKQLLRFYFGAEGLNRMIDKIIMRRAETSVFGVESGEKYFERLAELVEAKQKLSRLWGYLNGVMHGLDDRDISTLKRYAALRVGIKRLKEEDFKEIKRALTKFARHAFKIGLYNDCMGTLKEFYCLIRFSV